MQRSEDGGGSPLAVPTDAVDRTQVDHLIQVALDHYGRIDALVNTIGSNIPRRALAELTSASWSEMLATNLTAAFHLTQSVVPVLRAQGGGLFIHVSSGAVKKARPVRRGLSGCQAGVVGLAHGTMEEERAYRGPHDGDLCWSDRHAAPTPTARASSSRRHAHALLPEDVAAACLFVMRLPPRAHVPSFACTPAGFEIG